MSFGYFFNANNYLYVYQTIWFKAHLLRFFSGIWRKILILLIKNNISIKIKPWFQFEVLFFTEKMKIIDFQNSDFWKLLRPPLIQFSKFNNFLWGCWFLGKNLSNFVPPVWKLIMFCSIYSILVYFIMFWFQVSKVWESVERWGISISISNCNNKIITWFLWVI